MGRSTSPLRRAMDNAEKQDLAERVAQADAENRAAAAAEDFNDDITEQPAAPEDDEIPGDFDDFADQIAGAMTASSIPQPPIPLGAAQNQALTTSTEPDLKTLVQRTREKFQRDLDGCTAAKTALELRIGEAERTYAEEIAAARKARDQVVLDAEVAFSDAQAAALDKRESIVADARADLAQVSIAKRALDVAVSELNKAEA